MRAASHLSTASPDGFDVEGIAMRLQLLLAMMFGLMMMLAPGRRPVLPAWKPMARAYAVAVNRSPRNNDLHRRRQDGTYRYHRQAFFTMARLRLIRRCK
jgi:hypothetical protein